MIWGICEKMCTTRTIFTISKEVQFQKRQKVFIKWRLANIKRENTRARNEDTRKTLRCLRVECYTSRDDPSLLDM